MKYRALTCGVKSSSSHSIKGVTLRLRQPGKRNDVKHFNRRFDN
ncbi:hypothetical protein SAMN04488037_10230 [Shimia marina]|uniref:Uncharacterized protein n=1 Tax=Shimia marina TaxID=321267 RepID=A0A0P1FE52_9RHOB|nr:hypothetical protein SHM7688_03240 [Shimia marina]SFD68744.1 hypothetical protein SAMN04488037_10230 [Shimia marina]